MGFNWKVQAAVATALLLHVAHTQNICEVGLNDKFCYSQAQISAAARINVSVSRFDSFCMCGYTGLATTSRAQPMQQYDGSTPLECCNACPTTGCEDCCGATATSACCPMPSYCYPNCINYNLASCSSSVLSGATIITGNNFCHSSTPRAPRAPASRGCTGEGENCRVSGEGSCITGHERACGRKMIK